jgi:phospholipid-transporting ATPase
VILYYGSILIYWDDGPLSDGKIAGHWVWGTAMYTAGLVTVLLKAALITNIWTKYTVIAIPGSVGIWFIFLPIYAFVAPKLNISTEYVNTLPIIMSSPRFWLTIVALPAVCLIRDFAWKYAKRMYYPQTYHHVQEIQKYNIQDYRPRYVHFHDLCCLLRLLVVQYLYAILTFHAHRMEQFQKAIRKVRQVQRMRKQRGYAFSQTDESQARVLQAYDTTKERGRYGEMTSSRR